MIDENKRLEILAPAGSFESFTAAVNTGADAVYVGLKDFSARKNAKNFTTGELFEAAKICRLSGVKLIFALNTLVFDDEIKQVTHAVKTAAEAGVYAVIIQDLGLVNLIKKTAPKLKLHASTQMTINSISGVKAAEKLGFSRVVLARELTFREIEKITTFSNIETEIFIHGALCTSVSGQCFMSGFFGGDGDKRSANRGLCAQPCRLDFTVNESQYALSLKDLSIIKNIRQLEKIGVTSVKIEGRMKRPEYVAAAVHACYEARSGIAPNLENLNAVFSRGGFTDGYFTGKVRSMQGFRGREDVETSNSVLQELQKLYKKPKKRRVINVQITAKSGAEIMVTVECAKIKLCKKFPPAEKAQTRATTAIEVFTQLEKFGGTIFEAGEINCEIDENLFISTARINEIRRELISLISERLIGEKNEDTCD